MLSRSQLEEILSTALSKGGDFADIFIEETSQTSITFEDNKIDKISTGTDTGGGIRVIDGDSIYYAASEDTLFDPLMEKALFLANSLKKTKMIKDFGLKPAIPNLSFEIKKRPNTVPINDKVSIISKANETARSYGSKI